MATETRPAVVGDGDAAASGMPQLDPASYPNQIFWLILALIAIYLVVARVAAPRIGSVLAERQGAITNDIAAAEEMKLKAAEAEKAYEAKLAEARAEAHRIAEETREEIEAELAEKQAEQDAEIARRQEESEARIAEIREEALSNVERIAKETAEALVAQLGGDPQAGRVETAVDKELEARS